MKTTNETVITITVHTPPDRRMRLEELLEDLENLTDDYPFHATIAGKTEVVEDPYAYPLDKDWRGGEDAHLEAAYEDRFEIAGDD